MNIGEVVDYLDQVFRPELQEDYDNAGFLLGDRQWEYRGALVAVDLTEAVAAEAEALGVSLVVTHHPFIFSGVKRLTDRSETGRTAMRMIRGGIAAYAAHTNLDNLPWGVNGILAAKLGLEHTHILKPFATDPDIGAGMVGELPSPLPCDVFLSGVKEALGLPMVRTSGHDGRRPVRRVAICGGSGMEFIADAEHAGADIYLTADIKYHDFQRAGGGMILADIGHYESEQFAKDIIFRCISEKFSNFACRISEAQKSLVQYI
jgi:dinuclear metal center YbgI/SA1388 family protein